jgi:hypothetical protein
MSGRIRLRVQPTAESLLAAVSVCRHCPRPRRKGRLRVRLAEASASATDTSIASHEPRPKGRGSCLRATQALPRWVRAQAITSARAPTQLWVYPLSGHVDADARLDGRYGGEWQAQCWAAGRMRRSSWTRPGRAGPASFSPYGRSSESDQTYSSKVTSPGDSPFEIREHLLDSCGEVAVALGVDVFETDWNRRSRRSIPGSAVPT